MLLEDFDGKARLELVELESEIGMLSVPPTVMNRVVEHVRERHRRSRQGGVEQRTPLTRVIWEQAVTPGGEVVLRLARFGFTMADEFVGDERQSVLCLGLRWLFGRLLWRADAELLVEFGEGGLAHSHAKVELETTETLWPVEVALFILEESVCERKSDNCWFFKATFEVN